MRDVAHCLQCKERKEREKWGVNGGIQDERKTDDSRKQLTVTMFEIETNVVEPHFSFLVHFAILKKVRCYFALSR
jgi:hypothetical protein